MQLLYLGWFTTVVVFSFIYLIFTKDLGAAGFFGLFIGYIGGIMGNWLLTYVDSEIYFVDGFIDALWKKFFWKHGPQFFALLLITPYAYFLYSANFNFKQAFIDMITPLLWLVLVEHRDGMQLSDAALKLFS